MDASCPLPRTDQVMLSPSPFNLLGEGASKRQNEMKAHTRTSQGTNPACELVQVRVSECTLKRIASSAEFGFMRFKFLGAAAELLKKRDSSFPVEEVVGISDHGRDVLNLHDSSHSWVPRNAVWLWDWGPGRLGLMLGTRMGIRGGHAISRIARLVG